MNQIKFFLKEFGGLFVVVGIILYYGSPTGITNAFLLMILITLIAISKKLTYILKALYEKDK